MKVIKLDKTNHREATLQAVKILKTGGLIIYPTETCYGAGVDATNPKAINKLLSYKTFRQGKPISIAVSDQTMASNYVTPNTSAKNLYKKFLPGPLTVISKSKSRVAPYIESSTKTIGIRIPDHPLALSIIKKLSLPITATSANASYKKTPYSIKDILDNTSKKQQDLIDLVIDAGTLPKRPSSTIVDTTLDDPLVLRKGDTLIGDLAEGQVKAAKLEGVTLINSKSEKQTQDLAKSLLKKNWNHLQQHPLVFLLVGEMGAGKTQFSKGIGEFLGIKQPITSPTYTIEKEYPYTHRSLSGKFLHLDTWRMQSLEELDLLNLEERLKPKNIIAIEWADRTLEPLLKLAKQTNTKVITIKIRGYEPRIFSESPSNHRQIKITN